MPEAAYITVKKERGQIIVETPYKEEFVSDIKSSVDYTLRKWDKENRVWKVDLMHRNTVVALVRHHYRDTPAFLIEGAITTNLHTGEVLQQQTLFGEGQEWKSLFTADMMGLAKAKTAADKTTAAA